MLMKHFGIVLSFDEATGHGSIRPENGGRDLGFDRNGLSWDPVASPRAGALLSYHLRTKKGKVDAIDLHPAPARPGSARKSFSIFRSAGEDAETNERQANSQDRAGQTGEHTDADERSLVSNCWKHDMMRRGHFDGYSHRSDWDQPAIWATGTDDSTG
jgi:cold shock CspA family protein